MDLAEKLIYLRKKQGLTQLELAEKLDVSRQAVSRWEGGYAVPGTDNLKILSDLYGVSVDYLLNDAQDELQISRGCTEQEIYENAENSKTMKVRWIIIATAITIVIVMSIVARTLDKSTNEVKHSIDELGDQVETEIVEGVANTFHLN